MNPNAFSRSLADYILSGHAYLHCPTTESTRFLAELKVMARDLPDGGRQVFTWSQATGWRDGDGHPPQGVQLGPPDPQRVAQEILDLPESTIFVLKDFGFYLQHKTFSYADVVIAWLSEIRDVLASTGRTVIFLGPDLDVPAALANDIAYGRLPPIAELPLINSRCRIRACIGRSGPRARFVVRFSRQLGSSRSSTPWAP